MICENGLLAYNMGSGRASMMDKLRIKRRAEGVHVIGLDGDLLAVFYDTVGADPPEDAEDNAKLFQDARASAERKRALKVQRLAWQEEGVLANANQEGRGCGPYAPGTRAGNAWDIGWCQAKRRRGINE